MSFRTCYGIYIIDRKDNMMEVPIIYEDENMLAVEKPAGLLVYTPQINEKKQDDRVEETLVDILALKLNFKDRAERSGIVHRLDKETSGILLVAKNEEAEKALQELFKERKIEKKYTALVWGNVEPEKGVIDIPLARGPKERLKIVPGYDGKESVTEYKVEKYFPKFDMSLLSVNLKTGRTHQIRVHFSAIGHPVVGDEKYSQKRNTELKRQFLHASELSFINPFTNVQTNLESKLPADLEDCIKKLS